ncbi:hypothetical protein EOL96_01440 [Candidatus Saccharibacteria bacterium]|nr:hypothetical protein [Candidatus Saccharibacteria bacterium]
MKVRKTRVGKKAMHCCRTICAIEKRYEGSATQKRVFSIPKISWRPTRRQYAIASVVVVMGIACAGGYGLVYAEQQKQQQEDYKESLERNRIANEKSNECREQKVAAKAELLGKVTYDELYDYSVCEYAAE